MKNLQDLTRKESGLVIYENNEGILCNWSSINGFPRLFATALIGLEDELPDEYEVSMIDDLGVELDGIELIYSDMDENQFAKEFSEKVPAKCYEFANGTKVYAPMDWN